MSATERTIRLVAFMKLEAPSGDVNLCDGGFIYYNAGAGSEKYSSADDIFGTFSAIDSFEAGFGDLSESASIALTPNPSASRTDWLNDNIRESRVRFWIGEVGSDGKTVTSAELLADMLVDTLSRVVGADGSEVLEMELISRSEKLFLVNEGNVASETFHKSIWPGENGFNSCTDTPIPVAWGTASPPAGTVGGGSRRSTPGGGGPSEPPNVRLY